MTNAELSRILFSAREEVDMWADVVETRTGKPATTTRRVLAGLDAYRAERGWSPHGFGGEDENPRNVVRLEVEFYPDTRDADLTRFSQALDALEAQGVIIRTTQLGYRAPWPDECQEVTSAE